MPEPDFEGVFIDTHNYQVFDGFYQEWSHDQHIQVGWINKLTSGVEKNGLQV